MTAEERAPGRRPCCQRRRPDHPRGDPARPRRHRRADGDIDRALGPLPGHPRDARLLDGGLRRRRRHRGAVDADPDAPQLDDAGVAHDARPASRSTAGARVMSMRRTTRTRAVSTCPTSRRSLPFSSTASRSRSPARSVTISMSAVGRRRATGPTRPRSTRRASASRRPGSSRKGFRTRCSSRLFEANIRVPHKTISDLRAQIAALSIGAGEVLRLARRYGAEMIGAATRELIESSERRMRAAIAAVPRGHLRGRGHRRRRRARRP